MKKHFYLLLIALIMAATAAFASDSEQGTDPGLFTKGTFKFGLYNPFTFDLGTYSVDGEKESSWNELNFKTSVDYFFMDGFGAGLMLQLERDYEKYVDDDIYKYSEFLLGAGLIYGTSFGKINLYAKPYVAFGSEVNKYEYNGSSDEYKYRIFRTGIEIGSPIPLDEGSHLTINPKIGWRYTKYTYTDMTSDYDSESRFYVGVGLNMFLGCDDMLCDYKTDFENSMGRFSRGRNMFEYSTKLKLFNETFKETWDTGVGTEEEKSRINGIDFNFSYKRGILDGLLIGGWFSINAEKDKHLEDDYVYKHSGFLIGPVAEYHPFDKRILSNLFVEGSFGIGGAKYVYEDPVDTDESKYFGFGFDLNLGFDYGLTDFLSIAPRIGIESEIFKEKDTDYKDTDTNGYFSIGTRFIF